MVAVPLQTPQNAQATMSAHVCQRRPWTRQRQALGEWLQRKLQQNPRHRLSHHELLGQWQREQLIQKVWKHELSRLHRFRNHRLKISLPEEHSPSLCFLEAG